jgi:hypothetical protein
MNNFDNLFCIMVDSVNELNPFCNMKSSDMANLRECLERFYWYGLCNYSNLTQLIKEKTETEMYNSLYDKYPYFRNMLKDAFNMGKRVVIY